MRRPERRYLRCWYCESQDYDEAADILGYIVCKQCYLDRLKPHCEMEVYEFGNKQER